MASAANVLRHDTRAEQSFGRAPALFGRVSNDDYRKAIAQIVREIQSERKLDDEQLGEALGCSEGTVANARNQRGNLDPVTMLNIGALFGGEQRLRLVLTLVSGSPDEPPTIADRLERIEREAAAIRRELE